MKYLLDTNILVEHIRGKKRIEIDVLEKGSAISIITQAELYYGAHKSNDPRKTLTIITRLLHDLGLRVQTLDEDIVSEFGKIKADIEIKGTRLEDFDLLIAATAKVENLTLVTKNLKHFKRIAGLKLYDI
mgnify:CR=1 FL=1